MPLLVSGSHSFVVQPVTGSGLSVQIFLYELGFLNYLNFLVFVAF